MNWIISLLSDMKSIEDNTDIITATEGPLHIKAIQIDRDSYPVTDRYPFNLTVFRDTETIGFDAPVTFFVGENGTGKSTLLRGIARKSGIHIWENTERSPFDNNPYAETFHQAIDIDWRNGRVAGAFFGSDIFRHFAELLDQWAKTDPGQLDYFGGKSLLSQSHGQSILSFFESRYTIRGVYFLDEPENALSPVSQLRLLRLLKKMGDAGHAQFIIATHSPLLMACPGASIFTFDRASVEPIAYEETIHFQMYRDFMANPTRFLETIELRRQPTGSRNAG